MSKTIDERVVEMRFDNKQFESNVQTSLSTIEKLKKSLDMDGATKGLESIDSAAKKVDMSGLGSAILGIGDHGCNRPCKHHQLGCKYRQTDAPLLDN